MNFDKLNINFDKLDISELNTLIDKAVAHRDKRKQSHSNSKKERAKKLLPKYEKLFSDITYTFEYMLPIKFELLITLDQAGDIVDFYTEKVSGKLVGKFPKTISYSLQELINNGVNDLFEDIADILPNDQRKDLKKKCADASKFLKDNDLDVTDFINVINNGG